MLTLLPILAAISGEQLVQSLIWLIVAGLIYWLLLYLVNSVGLPDPFKKVARAILLIVAILFIINFLLSLTGHPILRW